MGIHGSREMSCDPLQARVGILLQIFFFSISSVACVLLLRGKEELLRQSGYIAHIQPDSKKTSSQRQVRKGLCSSSPHVQHVHRR